MGEGGRSCRKVDRGSGRARGGDAFDVEVTPDAVRLRLRGRVVRTLEGAEAEAIRAAVATGDDAAVARLVARHTGSSRRGDDR